MNEAAAYEALRPRLQALGLDPHRVENVLAAGMPDVNYSGGWIEMKWLEAWPKREATLVTIKTLVERPQQVAWLMKRWTSGGAAWIMLRVHRQLLLFSAMDARAVRLGRTRDELLRLACWRTDCHGAGDWEQLKRWLLWRDEQLPPPQRAKLLRLRCLNSLHGAALVTGLRVCDVERGETEDCLITNDLIDAWVS